MRSAAVPVAGSRRSSAARVDRANARPTRASTKRTPSEGRARPGGERGRGARSREATRVGAKAIGGGERGGTRAGSESVVVDDENRRGNAPARIARGTATAATAEAAAMLACESVASLRGAEGWRRRQTGLLYEVFSKDTCFSRKTTPGRPPRSPRVGLETSDQTEGADWLRAFIFQRSRSRSPYSRSCDLRSRADCRTAARHSSGRRRPARRSRATPAPFNDTFPKMSAMSANFAVAPAHVRSTAAIRRAGRASAKRVIARGVKAEAVKEAVALDTTKSDQVRLLSHATRCPARVRPLARSELVSRASARSRPSARFGIPSKQRICDGYQQHTWRPRA